MIFAVPSKLFTLPFVFLPILFHSIPLSAATAAVARRAVRRNPSAFSTASLVILEPSRFEVSVELLGRKMSRQVPPQVHLLFEKMCAQLPTLKPCTAVVAPCLGQTPTRTLISNTMVAQRSRRRGLASCLLAILASVVLIWERCDAFAGPSMTAAPAAVAATRGGGTRTPIKAIASPVTTKTIEPVMSLEEFERALARPKQVVVVWFQASWCRKCKYIGARLKHLDEHLPAHLTNNVMLVSIDVNKVAEVPQRQKIRDLPTIQFFVEGKEVGSYVATDRGEVFYGNMERHLRNALGEDVADREIQDVRCANDVTENELKGWEEREDNLNDSIYDSFVDKGFPWKIWNVIKAFGI